MSIFDDTFRRPDQLGDDLYEGLGSTGLGASTATAGSRRSAVNPTTEAILAQRANRTAPQAGTGVASQGQPPRQTRFSSTRTSIATPDRSGRTRNNSGTRGTTGRSGEGGTSGRQAITAPIISAATAQSSTAAVPRANTTPAASVDDFLKGLMRDERYWKPGPDQAPYRDGIARLFQAAYPGTYTPGSFSRTAEPATSVQDLQALAGSFLPRQPERTPLPPEHDDFPTERPPEDILDRLPLRKNGLLYLLLQYYYPDGIPATVERNLLTLTPGIPLADQPGLWPVAADTNRDEQPGVESAAEVPPYPDDRAGIGHNNPPTDLDDTSAPAAGTDDDDDTILGAIRDGLKDADDVALGVLGPAYEPIRGLLDLISPTHDVEDMQAGSAAMRDGIIEGDIEKATGGFAQYLTGLIGIADPGIESIAGKTAGAIASIAVPTMKGGRRASNAADSVADSIQSLPINPDTGRRVSRTENPLTLEEFEILPDSGSIDPNRIRPSQDTATERFSDGRDLNDAAAAYRTPDADKVPAIRIYEKDGKIYTLDHRRLVAGRLAKTQIAYRKATSSEVRDEIKKKFTTRDDGMTIELVSPGTNNRRRNRRR